MIGASAEAWLLSNVPGLTSPLRFARIGDGASNLTFRVDDERGMTVVLRRPPIGELLESAHDMAREYVILTALGDAGMPTPRPLALCQDPSIMGVTFYVMEHVDGLVLSRRAIAQSLPRPSRLEAGRSLARTLHVLQSIDLAAHGLSALKREKSYAQRQLKRWSHQWQASHTRDLPIIDQIGQRLADTAPSEQDTVLVHGDYRLDNAVITPDGRVRSVLDWELCTVGDPLADVGLMVAYWHELGAAAGTATSLFPEPVTTLEGFCAPADLVQEFAACSGRALDQLPWWIAFAHWKIAIVAEGVHRRARNDPRNPEASRDIAAAVPRLAALAGEALDGSWSRVLSQR